MQLFIRVGIVVFMIFIARFRVICAYITLLFFSIPSRMYTNDIYSVIKVLNFIKSMQLFDTWIVLL